MASIHNTFQIHVQDCQVWRWGVGGVEAFMYFRSKSRIANSSICYNRINATVRAYFDCILEKLDLRLPIRNVAVEEVQVWVSCLASHFTDKLVSSLNIDVTNHDGRAIRGPSSKEAFTKPRGTPRDDDGLVFDPSLIWHGIGVDSRGLADR